METKQYGICQLAVIPVRIEPSERSEQVTQIIFGETFEILEQKGSWSFIYCTFDKYNGWITTKMATLIPAIPLNIKNTAYLKDAIGRIHFPGTPQEYQIIPGGATLYFNETGYTNNNETFAFDPLCQVHLNGAKINIAETAFKFLNSPYLWGGRTVFGIDCSGLTQIVYKMNGFAISRDASQQAEQGTLISEIEDALPGDLAFFNNNDGKIIHTGIILENSKIMHASGKVRIDKIDSQGIFNEETKEYTHRLKLIRRVLSTEY